MAKNDDDKQNDGNYFIDATTGIPKKIPMPKLTPTPAPSVQQSDDAMLDELMRGHK